jgi:hypothetical protein
MPSASPISPFEDRAFSFAPRRNGAGELGVAAASGRRARAVLRASVVPPALPAPKRALGPLAFILAGLGAWALLIGGRAQIVRLAPETAPLYRALGFHVNPWRMGLDHVVSRLANEDGRPVLIVEGEIRNLSSSPRASRIWRATF